MFLKSLYLQNFRSYEEAEVHFAPSLNIIHGENASGKTNLLEAIHLVATGRSFRTQTLSELIYEGRPHFFLEAHIVRDGVEQKVKISFDRQTRRVQIGPHSYSSFHPLLGILPSVLYTPYDIELIAGAPSERRRFLNLHLAQSDPLYVHHLTRFWRAMKQRNFLLKTKEKASLDCWEIEMAQSNDYIAQARAQMIADLKEPLQTVSQTLNPHKETYELELCVSASKHYLQQLQRNRAREMELGVTLTGPHRDDLSLLIEKRPARLFASEGQKKTAIAALKLAEWERLCQRVGDKALIGFDDLGQHLDDTRQALLRGALSRLGQVFITTPHPSFGEGHLIPVLNTTSQQNLQATDKAE